MRKSFGTVLIFSLLFILFSNNIYSQNGIKYVIKGTIVDSNNRKPIPFSSVALTTQSGKNIIKSGMTDEKGSFSLSGISQGKYDLEISSMSYGKKTKSITIAGNTPAINLGFIKITKETALLPMVVIEEQAIPVVVKEDTIEYNAAAFKTDSNAMVEDLIKKLPGVEVDNNGTVTAHGTQVTKVLVDGKPFFGNDPVMATRNIPVDMVDKVQVIDAKSDQAVFTGVDDGSIEKVMNLITKPGRRNGTFGKMTGGLGGEYNDDSYSNKLDRFDAGANMNWYNGPTQLSLIGTANNINNIRFGDFSALGQSNSGGPGGPGGPGGRGGFGGFSNNNNGISASYSLGANFRDSIGHKISFTGSYLFTENKNDKEQYASKETFLNDTLGNSFYNSHSLNSTTNKNHNVNLEFDYRIDSMNSILFRPKMKITESNSDQTSDYATFYGKSKYVVNTDTINSGNSQTTYTNNHVYNFSSEVLLRHRFDKPRRTISLDITPSYTSSNSESNNSSVTNYFDYTHPLNNVITNKDSIDLQKVNKSGDFNLSSRLTYTEPLSDKVVMEVDYSLNYDNSFSDRTAYNNITKSTDSMYTNHYENTFLDNRVGVNIKLFKDKWDYTIGVGVEPSSITSHAMLALNKDTTLTQKVVNFSPQFNINYSPRKGKRLRIVYRGSTNQPSLSQMQPIPDNSNPLYVVKGNPALKPEFDNNINISYNTMNTENFSFLFARINLSNALNKITNQTSYNSFGQQTLTYTNANGYYNASAFAGIGRPIKKYVINLFTNTSYTNAISYSNEESYFTRTFNWSARTSLNYNGDKLIWGPSAKISYYNASYTLTTQPKTDYFNYTLGFTFQYTLPFDIKLGSDISYVTNNGYGSGYNLTTTIWNGFISKNIFKNKKGMFKFQVNDILQQNKSISRTTTDNYVEDDRINALPRFFLLSFSYSFSKFKGKKPDENQMEDPFRPRRFHERMD